MPDHEVPPGPPNPHTGQEDDPVARVRDADAWDRRHRYPYVVLRGPVFGFAQQAAGSSGWRLLCTMSDGYPQDARDGLNSHLWFKAKDDADSPGTRRELLDAVARLETEPVDEVTAGGVRYRVLRGDEFARLGPGGMEPPRPTDPEPAVPDWAPRKRRTPSRVTGHVIDPRQPAAGMELLERKALARLCYTAERYPRDVRRDSARALATHPGVTLLPATFTAVEEKPDSWEPLVGPQPTPHDARRSLATAMEEFWPRIHHYGPAETADYARAAARYRSAHQEDTLRVRGRCFRIVRTQSLVRLGPDGPEGPRPSDTDVSEPSRMHPVMDEHGTITWDH
ncbi:DUF5954 family protein [Streptomyces sp. NPDC054784]